MDLKGTRANESEASALDDVLIAGCGIGSDALGFVGRLGRHARITAIDPDPQLIEFARVRFGAASDADVRCEATSLERLDAKEHAFDRVIIGKGEHPSMNRRSVYASAFELMKPGGKMTSLDVIVGDGPSRTWAGAYPYQFGVDELLDGADIVELLHSVGYRSVSISESKEEAMAPLTRISIEAMK